MTLLDRAWIVAISIRVIVASVFATALSYTAQWAVSAARRLDRGIDIRSRLMWRNIYRYGGGLRVSGPQCTCGSYQPVNICNCTKISEPAVPDSVVFSGPWVSDWCRLDPETRNSALEDVQGLVYARAMQLDSESADTYLIINSFIWSMRGNGLAVPLYDDE